MVPATYIQTLNNVLLPSYSYLFSHADSFSSLKDVYNLQVLGLY